MLVDCYICLAQEYGTVNFIYADIFTPLPDILGIELWIETCIIKWETYVQKCLINALKILRTGEHRRISANFGGSNPENICIWKNKSLHMELSLSPLMDIAVVLSPWPPSAIQVLHDWLYYRPKTIPKLVAFHSCKKLKLEKEQKGLVPMVALSLVKPHTSRGNNINYKCKMWIGGSEGNACFHYVLQVLRWRKCVDKYRFVCKWQILYLHLVFVSIASHSGWSAHWKTTQVVRGPWVRYRWKDLYYIVLKYKL